MVSQEAQKDPPLKQAPSNGAQRKGVNTALSFYRGYRTLRKKRDGLVCTYLHNFSNYHMPRSFVWLTSNDYTGCHRFIDCLHDRDVLKIQEIEKSGLVESVQYEHPPAEVPIIAISPLRLLAVLRGEDVLEVPATAKLILGDVNRKTYISGEVWADMLDDKLVPLYIDLLRQHLGAGQPIIATNHHHLSKLDQQETRTPSSGFRLRQVARREQGANPQGSVVLPSEGAPSPVNEVELQSVDHTTHTETITLTHETGEQPFFTRRLVRKGRLLWCGTSYHAKGPWTEYHNDMAALTALRILP